MQSKQLILGNSAEEYIADYFYKKSYWAYILPKKIGGQPFDVIACKQNNTWFVDVKHLESGKASFPFSRIEPNQWTSMRFAKMLAGIQNLGFVIVWQEYPETPFFLHYDNLLELVSNGEKSVKIERLKPLGELI